MSGKNNAIVTSPTAGTERIELSMIPPTRKPWMVQPLVPLLVTLLVTLLAPLSAPLSAPVLVLIMAMPWNIGIADTNQITVNPTNRALFLSDTLLNAELKQRLGSCANQDFYPSDFAIAHRGAPLGYPEHSREGYIAAAQQGAGIIECDVTFTKDLALVCRHSQCDLATTTNILRTPLANSCAEPFKGATLNQSASAKCCTSDITLTEFKSLCARPNRSNRAAKTVSEFLAPLVSPVIEEPMSCGTLITHAESIELIDSLGRNFTPELKRPEVPMPFAEGFTQTVYADKMLAQYRDAGIDPKRVYPQSFNADDVWQWIQTHPEFAAQAVWLDSRGRQPGFKSSQVEFDQLRENGLRIIAPPIPMLIRQNDEGEIVASDYAKQARAAGLNIITWTFESGDPTAKNNWLYAPVNDVMTTPGQMLQVLHVLAKDVGVIGVFTDWPGTVSYYANCLMDPAAEP